MNGLFPIFRAVIFFAALLFTSAVVLRTISDTARERKRLEIWWKKAMEENQAKPGLPRPCRGQIEKTVPTSSIDGTSTATRCTGGARPAEDVSKLRGPAPTARR